MNLYKSGTLLVAIATVIVAIFILSTDRNDKKNVESVKSDKQEIEINATKANDEVTTKESIENEPKVLTDEEKLAAPDGPFDKNSEAGKERERSEEVIGVNNVKQSKVETSTTKINPDEVKSLAEESSPKLVAADKKETTAVSEIQPIWLEQNLGDFKSVDRGPVVFNVMPTSAEGLQGDNPEMVTTNKNDRFVSFEIPTDYNYQRMPMYNGGYYIAPMPSYLMPSILPNSIKIDAK